MRRSTLYTLAAVPLLALALACGAAGTDETTTSAPDAAAGSGNAAKAAAVTAVAVGQPLQLNRNFLGSKTVATVTVSKPRYNVKSGNQFIKPTRGQFIVVDVAIQSVEGKITLTQGSFKLVGADGSVYDTTMSFTEPALGFAELAPGQKTTGTVTFDAAANAQTGGKIALTDIFADGDAGYWTL